MIAVLGLALHFAVAHAKTVTLTSTLAHSSVVLAQLGKAAGVVMKPSGSVNQDYFFVHFTDTPLDVAMLRIAKTLNVTWEKQRDGSLVLTRTHNQELSDVQRNTSRIGALERAFLEANPGPFPKEKYRDLQQIFAKPTQIDFAPSVKMPAEVDPLHRLAMRLLRGIGVQKLASLPEDRTTWFSSTVGTRTEPLPQNAVTSIATYLDEVLICRHIDESINKDSAKTEGGGYVTSGPDPARPFVVALSTSFSGGLLSYDICIEQGSELIRASGLVPDSVEHSRMEGELKVPELNVPLKLSRRELEMVNLSLSKTGDKVIDGLPVWQLVLMNGVQRDFLDVVGGSLLRQTALACGKDMVALLPDDFAMMALQEVEDGKSLDAIWWGLGTSPDGIDISNDQEFLSIKPKNLPRSRIRLDRRLLTALAASLATGSADLDLAANFAVSTVDSKQFDVGLDLLRSLFSASTPSLDTMRGDALRIYGLLQGPQRTIAKSTGFSTSLARLGGAMEGQIDRLLFGSDKELEPPPVPVIQGAALLPTSNKLADRPEFSLGNGYPADSSLTVRVKRPDRLLARIKTKDFKYCSVITMNVAAAAIAMSLAEGTPGRIDTFGSIEFDGAVVPNVELTVDFKFPNVGSLHLESSFVQMGKKTKFGDYDSLPESWRSQLAPMIEKNLAELREQRRGKASPPPTNMAIALPLVR